jgi:two-component system NtrC family sensor kinase
MADSRSPELAEIERLEKKIAAQGRTIESLMATLAERPAGTEATQFKISSENVQLEDVQKRKTESLEPGLKEALELNLSLQNSQEFLNSVIDANPARLCILDENGIVIKVNSEWLRGNPEDESCPEIGVELEDFYRLRFAAMKNADALPNGIRSVVKRHADSYSEHSEFLTQHYQTKVAPIVGSSHTLVAHTNITRMIDCQAALDDERRQNHLLSLVGRHTGTGILIMNMNGVIEWSNRAYQQLTGVHDTDMTGFQLSTLAKNHEEIQTLEAKLRAGIEFQADVEILTVDKINRFMRLDCRRSNAVEGEQKLIVVATEITDHIRAKQALTVERQLFENVIANVPHGVYWKNRAGRYLGCNDAYAAQMSLPNRAALIGKTDAELNVAADHHKAQAAHESLVITQGIAALGIEETYLIGAETAHMLTSRVPLRNAAGEISGVVGVFADITSVKAMEDQLNQARRLEAIGQLSAGIAHEINTPMQYIGDNIQFLERATKLLIQIGGEVEKLAESHEDEDLRNLMVNWLRVGRFEQLKSRVPTAIKNAQEGVIVVSQIVQAMKAFTHPGDRELKLADLNAAIANTITVSRNEWKYVATIHTDFAEFCAVKCNLGELNQVFLNIIVNAAHAISDTLTDQRTMGRIKISTHDEPTHVEVRIADDGSGMPEHVRARIFEQFFTTKAVGSGTGQGLALAHAVIVDRHKGVIDVDSTPGEGTVFRIRIPKIIEDDAEAL